MLKSGFTIIVVTTLALLLTSCGNDHSQLKPLPIDSVILAFGDSLTYGTGAKSNQDYPAQLQEITGRKVINAGVPGELSSQGVKRLPQLLRKHSPSLLILCHGGNDLLRKKDKQQLTANLSQMIELAQRQSVQVILLGVPEPALLLMAVDPLYIEIAEKHRIPVEAEILPEVLSNNSLKSDPIHPNAGGYRKMAEAIALLLKQSGAILEVQ